MPLYVNVAYTYKLPKKHIQKKTFHEAEKHFKIKNKVFVKYLFIPGILLQNNIFLFERFKQHAL